MQKIYSYVEMRELHDLLLCLNTRIVAPDNLAPKMRDVWLSSSLSIKQPWKSAEREQQT